MGLYTVPSLLHMQFFIFTFLFVLFTLGILPVGTVFLPALLKAKRPTVGYTWLLPVSAPLLPAPLAVPPCLLLGWKTSLRGGISALCGRCA